MVIVTIVWARLRRVRRDRGFVERILLQSRWAYSTRKLAAHPALDPPGITDCSKERLSPHMPRRLHFCILSIDNGRVHRGVESWAIEFCRHMSELGHRCTLIQAGQQITAPATFNTVRVDYDYPERIDADPAAWQQVILRKLHLDRRGRDVLNFSLRCLVPLARLKPDIIIPASGPWTTVAAQTYRFLIGRRSRVIVTALAGYDTNFHRAAPLRIDGAVALEPLVLEKTQRRTPHLPATIIPMGVDLDRFRDVHPASISLPHPIVIVTAALVSYKRVDLAVRAAAQAGLSLLVVGDGPLRQQVYDLGMTLLGPSRFLCHPAVPFDQIASYYKAADVFTLPSGADEAFSIAIVEALAAGLPVVVNDDPVRRWMVIDRGQFVDARDTASYAAALVRAAEMKRLDQPPPSIQRFSWSSVAQQWAAFSQQVLSSKSMAARDRP